MANAYRSVLKDAVNPTGNALPADVLAGKTFSNADGIDKTGTMVNNGAVTITLTDQDPSYTVPEGYHNGSGTVSFISSGGDGADLVVTCSEDFAGATISCTDGTTTYTEICPSTSPYIVTFESIPTGTWTVSGVVEGSTYSQQVVITDFDVTLTAVFDYKQWVTLGGLDPTDYASLSEVFADEVAVRRLMTIHASADYLIEKVTDDIDTIDDFTANDTAMKWIGLRDYVCDGLTAIAGVEAKFLASQYWERYLKDHVPVMTSNTAPYGTVVPTSNNTTYPAWKMFDSDDSTAGAMVSSSIDANNTSRVYYLFTNPICIKKALIKPSMNCTGKIQYSDDGSTWTDATDIESFVAQQSSEISVNNDGYHLYWAFFANSWQQASVRNLITIQFYGRSLDVSVPVMTSNSAPYGEIIATSLVGNSDTNATYKAYDNNISTWGAASATADANDKYIGYGFGCPILVRFAKVVSHYSTYTASNCVIQGSNDKVTWNTCSDPQNITGNDAAFNFVVDSDVAYKYWRVYAPTLTTSGKFLIEILQFYGVDYSEREFAEGSTMKYLYDHGVELENIEINDNTTKEDDYISIKATTTTYYGMIVTTNSIDLTDYSIERVKIGDVMSGGVQIQASAQKTSYNSGRIGYKTFNVAASDLPNNLYYDVSAVNQNVYPNIVTSQVNNTIDISEWWLE